MKNNKPDIFLHHDIREYLGEWLDYKKSITPKYSLRRLAKDAALSPGYLPLVLSRKRTLTAKALDKLLPSLGLSKDEARYFHLLRTLNETDKQSEREASMIEIQKMKKYQIKNTNNLNAYKYLNHWLNVTIREMTELENFKFDAQWIRSQLVPSIPISKIQEAMDFLAKENYIKFDKDGNAIRPDHTINCNGGVYRLSMSQFHTQMLQLAVDSIYNTPATQRNIVSNTIALNPSDFESIQDIMNEALDKVQKIAKNSKNPSEIYHFAQLAFPLTGSKGRGSES